MLSVFFAIITLIGWGIGDIFGAIASRKTDGYTTTIYVFAIAFILASFYIPFEITNLYKYTLPIFLLNIFLGILLVIGNTAINEAMRRSNASLVGVISSAAYSGPSVLFAALLFNESLSFMQIIGLILVFIGVITCSINFKELQKNHFNHLVKDKGILLALLAMICWSIDAVFLKVVVNQVGWFWPIYIFFSLFPLILIYVYIKKIRLQSPIKNKAYVPIFLSAIFLHGAEFTFNMGIKQGAVSIVSSISGAYPVLFAVLAFFIFKDRITKQQLLGIILTLIGVLTLSLLS